MLVSYPSIMTLSRSLSNSEKQESPMQILISDKIERFLNKKFRISHSYATISTYRATLNKAQEFLRIKKNLDLSQLLILIQEENLDPIEILDDFYTYLSNVKRKNGTIGYSSQAIKAYVVTLKEFLNSEGCRIYSEDVRRRIKFPKRQDVYSESLTKEIISRLLRLSNYKLATVILIAASSGMRIGELLQLKLSDIDFTKKPTQIHIRAKTSKTRQSRITHISSEATNALKDYLSRSNPAKENDDYVFLIEQEHRIAKIKKRLKEADYEFQVQKALDSKRLDELQKQLESDSELALQRSLNATKHNYEEQLQRVVKSIPELSKKAENGRYNIHFHAFRAWFKTQVTDAHQSDFAEALMGHKSLKLVYYRQNEKTRAKTYLGVEHALTISDTEKIDNDFSELQRDNFELRGIVDSLSKQLRNLEKRIIE